MDHNNVIPAGAKGAEESIPEISIIVPVYKVEKFLRECLDSIKAQTFTDWECILVDDGSPDGSGKICEEYAAEDTRFKVIHRVNGGLSAARNTGIAACHGRYVSFVDSDDVTHDRMLERLYALIKEYDADVSMVSYESLYVSKRKEWQLVEDITVLDRASVVRELIKDKMLPSYMWNKLFRREVIDTPFPEGRVFEDIYTLTSWVKNIKKIVISPEVLYSYRQRGGSIINSDSSNRIEYVNAIVYRVNHLRDLEPEVVGENVVETISWKGLVSGAKSIARYVSDAKLRKAGIERLSEFGKTLPAPRIATLGLKKWWRAILLMKSPALFIKNARLVYLFNSHKRRRNSNMFN